MDHNLRTTHADEEACGKLWEMYAQEARRYDEGLVRSWKEDMDVTLVFSGLYSAILTAFIIESYQNLQEQSADTSVVILRQISSQISALSGAGNATQEPANSKTFDPSTSAIICNTLWFSSLSLALLCTFLATFVQQWARKFLHRTTMVRSPTSQAHLIQFFYFGLKDFGVHAIVDAIPSLLHLSIFLFFVGLAAFLVDVNIVLVYMIAVILFLIASLYISFTILPIATLRSFYQTPLSPVIWRLWQSRFIRSVLKRVRDIFSKRNPASDREMAAVDGAVISATTARGTQNRLSPQSLSTLQNAMLAACRVPNHDHEMHSVAWTMKSVNDDVELLLFVEAIIDALWGLDDVRTKNLHLIRYLLETSDPHLNIIIRVFSLFKNVDNPWFNDNHRKRCSVVFPKFFWILGCIFLRYPDMYNLPEIAGTEVRSIVWFSFDVLACLARLDGNEENLDPYYASSAAVLCMLSMCDAVQNALSSGEAIYHAQLKPFSLYTNHSFTLIDADQREGIRSVLIPGRCASAVGRYLENAAVSFPYQFDQTIACFWECKVRIRLYEDSALAKLTSQIERYSLKNQQEVPKGIPSLPELDRIFRVICLISPEEHASGVVSYIARRVDVGGWKTTHKIWSEEKVLNRFYDLINSTSPADWNENYFVAFNEVVTSTPYWSSSPGPPQFWGSLLQRYRGHIAGNAAQTTPYAASLQLRIMICFLHDNFSNTLFSHHLLAYAANNAQLHQFCQEYLEKDAEELFSVLLILTITDPHLQRSPAQLKDVLSFYLERHHTIRMVISRKNKLFGLPGMLKELSDHTKALADDWVQEPSVERLEILLMVWLIWRYLLQSPELCSKPRSEFITLSDASQIVLEPESRRMITQVRERGGESYDRWLKIVFRFQAEADLPKLIEEVLSRLPDAPGE